MCPRDSLSSDAQVANYVLAAISMVSPPLRGFTHRAFPYTNLTNLDTVLAWYAQGGLRPNGTRQPPLADPTVYRGLAIAPRAAACTPSPGFIAGVTNPRYDDMERWWDVLCNVATGAVKYATHLPPLPAAEPHVPVDNEFIAEVRGCSAACPRNRGQFDETVVRPGRG